MKDKIYSMLYNTGSYKDRCYVTSVYCDQHEECSLYKQGRCMGIPQFLHPSCSLCELHRVYGYTNRAKAYDRFVKDARNDPTYNALQVPNSVYIYTVGDKVLLDFPYVDFDGTRIKQPNLFGGGGRCIISKEDFTADYVHTLVNFHPRTVFDNVEIKKYQEEVVPKFLYQLKILLVDVYNELLTTYPEDNRVLSNKGQKAKVSSLKDGIKLSTNHGTFTKQGDKLICDRYKPLFGLFGVNSLHTEITITEDMIYEIKDDSEWDDDTVFI